MSKKVFLIGHPIGHSISPIFQQAAFDYHGMDVTYEAIDVKPNEMEEFVDHLRGEDILGANVTVPYKELIIPMLDSGTEEVAAIGAVNTIVNTRGKLTGNNTDSEGFLRSILNTIHLDPSGKAVLLLGAGGAARAVAVALARKGASSIFIANRDLDRAHRLVDTLRPIGNISGAIGLDSSRLGAISKSSDIIVNCTSLGMSGGPGPDLSPIYKEFIPEGSTVIDLVYNPSVTPILRDAQDAGAQTLGGLTMLVYQGSISFKMWTGIEPPTDTMLKVARKALEKS
tara:strand:- start:50 stop:901 length:852 start_codon:yes stop_codon:yes gene_type:complete